MGNDVLAMGKKAKVIKSQPGVKKLKRPQEPVVVELSSSEIEASLVRQIEQDQNFIKVESSLDFSSYGFNMDELRQALFIAIDQTKNS